MPTRFETMPVPPFLAVLPLLFLRRDDEGDSDLSVSLAAAAAADRACLDRRNSRARLAWLVLSRVVETDGRSMRILDWSRLCALGGYDPRRLGHAHGGDETPSPSEPEELPAIALTRAGEPACFV